LPHAVKPLRARIDAMLEQHRGTADTAQIEYHEHPRFLIRCGNAVAEFDPAFTADQAQERALRQLEPTDPACKRLADDAAHELRALFEQHFLAAGSNLSTAATPLQETE
jgi:hypothetical protein